jgi:hypothetical protein
MLLVHVERRHMTQRGSRRRKRSQRHQISRHLTTLLPAFVALAVVAIGGAFIFVVPDILVHRDLVPDGPKRIELRHDERATLLQSLTAILVLIGAYVTWRQLQVSREGQVTERFTRAVEQLGNDKRDVRLGAIYALEAIARAPSVGASTIVDILSAYVREHAPWPAPQDSQAAQLKSPSSPREAVRFPPLHVRAADVEAAIKVMQRILPRANRRLNLASTD